VKRALAVATVPSSLLSLWLLLWLLLGAADARADGARYRVTFDSVWSSTTHPTNFPSVPHFSPLVGGTHNASVVFWQVGGLASNGIEQMAEEGASAPLALEIQAELTAGDAASAIAGGGINPSPGSVSTTFDITSTHPLVTLVAMIAPSPDWFVGVSGLSLRSGGSWINELSVDLDPYDAGTDSGISYEDPDADTDPQDPIAQITGFPFTGTGPLGTFTFEFLRTLEECEDLIDNDLDGFTDFGVTPSADPGCDGPSDTSEKSNALVCDDGVDNDMDSLIDFPMDPGCSTILDSTEEDPVTGASLPAVSRAGLAVLATLLLWVTHRNLRRRASSRDHR
jgi:hypothetical protein